MDRRRVRAPPRRARGAPPAATRGSCRLLRLQSSFTLVQTDGVYSSPPLHHLTPTPQIWSWAMWSPDELLGRAFIDINSLSFEPQEVCLRLLGVHCKYRGGRSA